MSSVVVGAPMRGWASALDEMPDPVFAERMMGEGLAIDPLEGEVRAPCAARVVAVAPTRHSVTLELDGGAQLLIHVGLETVGLGGEGFTAHVEAGDDVASGDLLLGFDLDLVARRAKSLVTPIVVANEGYALKPLAVDRLVEASEPLFELTGDGAAAVTDAPVGDDTAMCELKIPFANGVHARPAARIVAALKPFSAEVSFAAHGRTANARSTVALLALGLKQGDHIQVTGKGEDARAAVASVVTLIEMGMDEEHGAACPPLAAPAPSGDGLLRGVCASPGLASGPVAHLRVADAEVPEQGEGVAHEMAALDKALHALAERLDEPKSGAASEIAAAHRSLLDDPELLAAARREIAAGRSAGFAWRATTRASCEAIRATGDRLLIERIADLVDVERQLIAELSGTPAPAPSVPEGAILVAGELLPSQFIALDASRLAGIVTARGGPTSHVAILAASAGVPMFVAAGEGVLDLAEGQRVLLDAGAGTLDPDPDAEALAAFQARSRAASERRAAEAAAAHELCFTADGARIEIFANLGSAREAAQAVEAGAEGCGLLRTEFLFLDRETAPDEEEQRAAYASIAAALEDRPLIVRTLDIGGDKPVPYLPFAPEENPALGLRGVRLSLARPELLAKQLRAILRAVPAEQCRIMAPMIVDVAEFRQLRAILDDARAAVGRGDPVPLGVMIETPAAALLADQLAAEADFLSIGSNDLTQYALAADRGNPALAARIDPLHPAVLRLIAAAGEGARKHGKWLGVCGGVASDPAAAPVLIGLGVTELSATPAAIPALKAAVRRLRLDECRALAERALRQDSPAAVRALLDGAN